jgi:hypothetical protein
MLRGRQNAATQAQNAIIRSRLSSVVAGSHAVVAANLTAPNQNATATVVAPALVLGAPNANAGIMDASPSAERLARIDEIRESLRRDHRAALRETATKDYDSCNNNFESFVKVLQEDEFTSSSGTIYTVQHVELFFQIVIANKTCLPKSAKKFLYAIEYHAKRADPPAETVLFRTEAIFEALAIQEERCKMQRETATYTAAQDPHSKRRTDVLSVPEIRAIIHEIIGRHNWKDMFTSWTVCEQSMLRMASMRQLRMCHLRCNMIHGPPILDDDHDARQTMLEIVLQPGLHKTGKTVNMQPSTGLWRHKDYMRCGTFAMAANVLIQLWDNQLQLHFFRNADGSKPDWQSESIITSWSNANDASTAYNAVLDKLGICWAKVTHLRTLAIEYASRMGLSRGDVASLSKHSISSLDDCYATELKEDPLRVMSVGRDKVYDVPRARLALPDGFTIDSLVFCFCPEYEQWLTEQVDPVMGDNLADKNGGESGARNFLLGVVPFFCRVLFQDGIYWIRDYPDHEISRFLLSRLPAWYSEWAEVQRGTLNQLTELTRNKQIENLNDASTAAFVSVGHKIVNAQGYIERVVREQCQAMRDHLGVAIQAHVDRRFDEVAVMQAAHQEIQAAHHEQLLAAILGHQTTATTRAGHGQTLTSFPHPRLPYRCDVPVVNTNPGPACVTPGAFLPRQAMLSQERYQYAMQRGALTSPADTTLIRHSQAALPDLAPFVAAPDQIANPFANGSPLPLPEPNFAKNNNNLPSSFKELVREVQDFKLYMYQGLEGRRSHWSKGKNKALGKRLYLFGLCVKPAANEHSRGGQSSRDLTWSQKLLKAATKLDKEHIEKGKMTMAKAYDHFKEKPGAKRPRPGAKRPRQSRAAVLAAAAAAVTAAAAFTAQAPFAP